LALSRGMRVQTADPSDSLWAAVVAVRALGLLLFLALDQEIEVLSNPPENAFLAPP
jgi:hypothetical protein